MRSKVTGSTKINIIVGDPVSHSLTPALHNAAYKQLGIEHEFVMTAGNVKAENLKAAVAGLRALGANGITVTTPHKETIIEFLDELEDDAKEIGAVNTIVNRDGKLVGSNTDWIGIVEPLAQKLALKGLKVLVLGAGGASRAAIFGLKHAGAAVTVANRTREKAIRIANEFSIDSIDLDTKNTFDSYNAIINCTSAGMGSDLSTAVSANKITSAHVVFETIYYPRQTPFIEIAEKAGAVPIYGTDMFFHQALAQIERQVGKRPDKSKLWEIFVELLSKR